MQSPIVPVRYTDTFYKNVNIAGLVFKRSCLLISTALANTLEFAGTMGAVQTAKTFFFCDDGLVGLYALHALDIR